MDEKTANRRSWIKNIAIIFLLIMLLLTFFSNTIMNYSLPEVATEYPESGTITTRIKGQGTLEANFTYELKMPETRTIKDVGIRQGSKVAEGDVLFVLEAGESPDYTAAEKAYENAKIAYESELLKLPEDFTSYLNAITEAEEALEKAKKQSGIAHGVTLDEVEDKLDELADEKSYLTTESSVLAKQLSENSSRDNTYLYRDLDDAQLEFEKSDSKSTADMLKQSVYRAEDALAEIETTIENTTADKEYTQKQYDELVKKVGSELDDDDPLKGDYRTLEDMLTAHETLRIQNNRTLDDLRSELNDSYTDYTDAMAALAKAQADFAAGTIDEKAYNAAADAMNTAADSYNKKIIEFNRKVEDIRRAEDDSELDIKRFREDLAVKESDLAESSSYKGELDALSAKLEGYTEKLAICEREKKTAQTELDDAKENHADANDKYLLLSITSIDRRIKAIEDEEDDLGDIRSDLEKGENAEDAIKDAERALSDARNKYNRAKKEYENSQKINSMELEQQKKELDRLKEEYEKLKSGESITEIKSPVSGVVSSVSVGIGDEVQMNQVIANIQLVDKGYSVSFNVTNEQAKRIKTGDVAEVQHYYGGGEITARVESVGAVQGSSDQKKVTLAVMGEDLSVGRNLTFTLGERSQSYDIVIPKSALKEDSNGNFVLVVVAKNSPLGTRYTAQRRDVTVIASDDTKAAVTGNLTTYSDFIITTSSSPVTSGMQVRLKES